MCFQQQPYLIDELFIAIFNCAFAGDLAEYDDVCDGISAETVSAVNTADHFTCGEESGDRVAVFVDYSGICINVDTAHGMVDAGRDLDRIERSLAQILIHAGCTAEIGIILISDIFVPVLQGFSKSCGIYIDLFRKFFDCVALHGDAGGHTLRRRLRRG